jgi:hypothetical protein
MTTDLPEPAQTDGRAMRVIIACEFSGIMHRRGPDRWKERSRTLQGIAEAMADQWGSLPSPDSPTKTEGT